MAIKEGVEPEKLIKKYQSAVSKRANFEDLWQQCADYISPRRDGVQFKKTPGEQKFQNLFNSVAISSADLLAGQLHGMLTNPSGYFFGLSTGVPDIDNRDDVRKYLQQVTRRMHDTLNNSNFQTEVHELYGDMVCMGQSAMSIEEDPDNVVAFSTRPLREIYLEENSKGKIDTLYRCYESDARGLVDDFGYKNLPKKVKEAYDDNKPTMFKVLHSIYPKGKGSVPKEYSRFKYLSQYILVDQKSTLSVKGFNEFPYVTPRWSKIAGETYGRGPGERALPEAKVVNKMTETTLRGAQKVVDPPLQAPDDGFVLNIITKPGGLNYYRSGTQDRIEPIFNDARIDFGYQAIQMKETQIREAFYVDQLKLREGPQMTATEVMERTEQALRFLGPMLGRQQIEFLQPLIIRVYNIMERRGMFDDLDFPDVLAERELKIQYTSVAAMSQRLSELQNIQRTMQQLAPFAAIDPTVMDNINGDQAVKFIAKLLNFPQEMLRDQAQVVSMREQRAKQQQALAEAARAAQEAENVSKVAGAASKVKAA